MLHVRYSILYYTYILFTLYILCNTYCKHPTKCTYCTIHTVPDVHPVHAVHAVHTYVCVYRWPKQLYRLQKKADTLVGIRSCGLRMDVNMASVFVMRTLTLWRFACFWPVDDNTSCMSAFGVAGRESFGLCCPGPRWGCVYFVMSDLWSAWFAPKLQVVWYFSICLSPAITAVSSLTKLEMYN